MVWTESLPGAADWALKAVDSVPHTQKSRNIPTICTRFCTRSLAATVLHLSSIPTQKRVVEHPKLDGFGPGFAHQLVTGSGQNLV